MTTRRQLTRKKNDINKNSTAMPTCSCGSPHFNFGPVEELYVLECLECDIDLTIPPELLRIGEKAWLEERDSEENNIVQDTEPKVFKDLDELWKMVKDFKANKCLLVKRVGQAAQGAINEIKADPRFEQFKTRIGGHRLPFQKDDPSKFTICRKC